MGVRRGDGEGGREGWGGVGGRGLDGFPRLCSGGDVSFVCGRLLPVLRACRHAMMYCIKGAHGHVDMQ